MNNTLTRFLTGKRTFFLLVLYFGGYLFLFPRLTTMLTLAMNPNAEHIALPLILITYAVTLSGAIALVYPILKGEGRKFLEHKKEYSLQIIFLFIVIIILNLGVSLVTSILTQSTGSNNQEAIIESSQMAPMLTAFSAICIAPILEEIVFRGGAFSFLRKYVPFFVALLISSFLFGSIHIVDSLMKGDFLDLSYLFVYSVIGCVLGYSYEKSDCLIVPIMIHMLNNIMAFTFLMM